MKYVYLFMILACCLPGRAQYAWEQQEKIPGAIGRWGAFCFALNNKIYVGGGYAGGNVNKSDFWEYNPATNTWLQKANVPGGTRSGALAFAIGNKGYMGFGGKDIFSQPYLNDLWEYDATADTWTRKADMPDSGRTHCTWFVLNNKAYIVGGSHSYSFWQSRRVWEYDPAGNQWAQKADYPVGIEQAQGFALGSYGYIVGGSDSGVTYNATYQYDPAANTWTQKADFCDARESGVAFTMGNMAYVGLGMTKQGTSTAYTNSFCRYDPAANTWTTATDMTATGRAYGVATVLNGKAYAGAGFYYNGAENYMSDWSSFGFPTGVSTVTGQQQLFTCSPNPATEAIHVSTTLASPRFALHSMIGQCVHSGTLGQQNTIDISGLAAGRYILSLSSGETTAKQMIEIAAQ